MFPFLGLNYDQWSGLARDALKYVGIGLATKGYIDEGTWTLVSGAILALGTSAVSAYLKNTANKIASVAAMPELQGQGKGIVTTPQLAAAIPARNVVSTSDALNEVRIITPN